MIDNAPTARTLVDAQLARNEKHATFMRRRFEGLSTSEIAFCETLAQQVLALGENRIDELVDGYEFICQVFNEEELHFRRKHRYRLSTFDEALKQIYSNGPYMESYMRGLLVTQLFWSNHTKSIDFYTNTFLRGLKPGTRLLEIGPGHGLLLARAVQELGAGAVTAWDVSQSSLKHTRAGLRALGVTDGVTLKERNLFEAQGALVADDEKFDAVVFSEVLEHVDEPERALQSIRSVMQPDGKLFINVPINSPAPDHIFLLRSPEEAVKLVEDQGFSIVDTAWFPATNYTLEQAKRHDLTVSVCIIATPGLRTD